MISTAQPAESRRYIRSRHANYNKKRRKRSPDERWADYTPQKQAIADRKAELRAMTGERLNREIERRYRFNVEYLGMDAMRAAAEALQTLKQLGASI